MEQLQHSPKSDIKILTLLILILLINDYSICSGAYENGTSSGKGNLQIDITWNPFNIIEQGQSYIVAGYGLNNKFDIHGYISDHPEKFYSYYYGLYYQFIRSERPWANRAF